MNNSLFRNIRTLCDLQFDPLKAVVKGKWAIQHIWHAGAHFKALHMLMWFADSILVSIELQYFHSNSSKCEVLYFKTIMTEPPKLDSSVLQVVL